MPDDGGVSAKLAGAKKALSGATSFTTSVEGHPHHEFSGASYKMAHQASKPAAKPAQKSTGEDVAEGLKAKRENVEAYTKVYGNQ
jgi:hypothetical protein